MTIVSVKATVMGFRLPVTPSGVIHGTGISILPFTKKLKHIEWDRDINQHVLINKYYYFDTTNQVIYLPRYILPEFEQYLTFNGLQLSVEEIAPVKGTDVEFHMLPFVDYKSDIQKNAVAYLVDEDSGPVRSLALQTGKGKTISYIWALQKIGKRSVTTMTSRLEQWFAEIQKYTTLDESDIYVIAGLPSLTKLIRQIDTELFPKVILASTKTIRLYMEYGPSYQHLPHPSLICETLGIGVWGSDESHESFTTNFMVGVTINPNVFVPITATFTASHPYVKEIIDKFYPKKTQFVGGAYDRYVDVTAYTYGSGGGHIQPYHYRGRKGYSQQTFEKYLMSKKGRVVLDPLIQTAIIPIIKEHYINVCTKGEKLLFLCASLALCDHLEGILRREFPDKKVSSFYTGKPSHILENFDIILSTPGSAGTGRDIKNLLTCFVFESTQSETRNLQFIGRLRDFPAVKGQPQYVYLSFTCIPQHVSYAQARTVLYGPRSKSFKHRSIQ